VRQTLLPHRLGDDVAQAAKILHLVHVEQRRQELDREVQGTRSRQRFFEDPRRSHRDRGKDIVRPLHGDQVVATVFTRPEGDVRPLDPVQCAGDDIIANVGNIRADHDDSPIAVAQQLPEGVAHALPEVAADLSDATTVRSDDGSEVGGARLEGPYQVDVRARSEARSDVGEKRGIEATRRFVAEAACEPRLDAPRCRVAGHHHDGVAVRGRFQAIDRAVSGSGFNAKE